MRISLLLLAPLFLLLSCSHEKSSDGYPQSLEAFEKAVIKAISNKSRSEIEALCDYEGVSWADDNIKNLMYAAEFTTSEGPIIQEDLKLREDDPIASVSGSNAWLVPESMDITYYMVWRGALVDGSKGIVISPVVQSDKGIHFAGIVMKGSKR